MEGNSFTWRSSRGSGGRLGSCRAVVLYLKTQITQSDFVPYHASWLDLPPPKSLQWDSPSCWVPAGHCTLDLAH